MSKSHQKQPEEEEKKESEIDILKRETKKREREQDITHFEQARRESRKRKKEVKTVIQVKWDRKKTQYSKGLLATIFEGY
eukprot:CAMPEP_0197009686 /NCGR_PEP_ID=MMETSP1380-20130617/51115_1 /TAXON_ID=5936 /ORGANISM="Euplotes crassus, Strain CT5" /LENGTH=79 /DNA_ID=CAMNT_0042431095 /DNA_START=6 /DNA_END=242 /DNA_ORIENTATION=+